MRQISRMEIEHQELFAKALQKFALSPKGDEGVIKIHTSFHKMHYIYQKYDRLHALSNVAN